MKRRYMCCMLDLFGCQGDLLIEEWLFVYTRSVAKVYLRERHMNSSAPIGDQSADTLRYFSLAYARMSTNSMANIKPYLLFVKWQWNSTETMKMSVNKYTILPMADQEKSFLFVVNLKMSSRYVGRPTNIHINFSM